MAKKSTVGWAGFDLGGTKMRVLIYDAALRPLSMAEGKTNGAVGPKAGISRMVALLEEARLTAARRVPRLRLAGIGLACPGPVEMQTGVIREMVNVGWKSLPIARLLSKASGVPVSVLNDVDAGTYGEYRFGAGRGGRCVVGVFPGTGVGGGCVHDGQVLAGAHLSALELGHLPVMPGGLLCGCGQQGCLETLAARPAIAAAALRAASRGEAPHLLDACGMDLGKVRSKALARAIAAGDGAVEAIVRTAAQWLGVGVAAAVNLLAPDIVVLGGGLVEEMPKLYLAEVERTARLRVMRPYRDGFKVRVAQLTDNPNARGAAAWAAECHTAGSRRQARS